MEISKLISNLLPEQEISKKFAEFLAGHLRQSSTKKGEILVAAGTVVDKTWIVIRGLAKSRYYDAAGRQVVTRFWKENEIIMLKDEDSADERSYAAQDIVMLEDSVIAWISNHNLSVAFEEFDQAYQLARKVYFAEIRSRDLRQKLLVMDATAAYGAFCKAFPAHRMLIQDIASYLNVRPYTLSRIRSQRN